MQLHILRVFLNQNYLDRPQQQLFFKNLIPLLEKLCRPEIYSALRFISPILLCRKDLMMNIRIEIFKSC